MTCLSRIGCVPLVVLFGVLLIRVLSCNGPEQLFCHKARAKNVGHLWTTFDVRSNWKHAHITHTRWKSRAKNEVMKKNIFQIPKAFYVWSIKKSPTVSMGDMCWGEGSRFLTCYSDWNRPSLNKKPNFPLCAKNMFLIIPLTDAITWRLMFGFECEGLNSIHQTQDRRQPAQAWFY